MDTIASADGTMIAFDRLGGGPPVIMTVAIAHTLAYDAAIIGDRPCRAGLLAAVTVPALVITGEQSPPFLRNAAQAAAQTLPHGQLSVLPRQTHDLNPGATAPVMAEFLAS